MIFLRHDTHFLTDFYKSNFYHSHNKRTMFFHSVLTGLKNENVLNESVNKKKRILEDEKLPEHLTFTKIKNPLFSGVEALPVTINELVKSRSRQHCSRHPNQICKTYAHKNAESCTHCCFCELSERTFTI